MFLFRVMHAVPYTNRESVKDIIANLHSYFTCNLLIGLAVLISYRQFGGRPLECMLPMGFSGAWEQYAEQYCWAEDTYFVPTNENVENFTINHTEKREVSYYQWMPFFLLFQAACFKMPTFIWKYFASQSGMRVGEILRMATDPVNSNPEDRKSTVESLSMHLQGALRFHKRLKNRNLVPHKICRFLNVKYSGYYVTMVYFVAKIGFLINNIFQLDLLQKYLIPDATEAFGLDALTKLLDTNITWKDHGIFPRVSICDFEVREMGQRQKHTVQCVLVINIFTEKIFIILWFWFSLLFTLTVCNLFAWIFSLYNETSRNHFIINNLIMGDVKRDSKSDEFSRKVNKFVRFYLGWDGILVLRLIAQHADVVLTVDLISCLWEIFINIEKRREEIKNVDIKWDEAKKKLTKLERTDEYNNLFNLKNDYENINSLEIKSKRSIKDKPLLHRSLSGEYLPKLDSSDDEDNDFSRKLSKQTEVISRKNSLIFKSYNTKNNQE
uniref:Innexin n=1 Tax=Strongyloides stercoralis TaxID=6248 RepID=A0A0K0EG62_STRER